MANLKSRLLASAKSTLTRTLGVEVTTKRFYPHLRYVRSWSSDDVVFDVGANDGRTVVRLQRHLPRPRIYAFEPVAATYRKLVERTQRYPNVRTFQNALGSTRERRTIYLHEVDAMNSFSADWSASTGTEEVDVRTVDEVMQEEGIDFVHFLKIDTEGHDLDVLRGAEGALRDSRIALIQVEAGFDQLDRTMPTLEDFRHLLAPYGYHLYGLFNQVKARAQPPSAWPPARARGYHARVLAYGDAVFVGAHLNGAP